MTLDSDEWPGLAPPPKKDRSLLRSARFVAGSIFGCVCFSFDATTGRVTEICLGAGAE